LINRGHREKQNEETRRQIEGWSALTKNIMIWDYNVNYNDYLWYLPNFAYIKENMKTYQRMGAHYIMKQGANNVTPIWHDDLKAYISSKLFWDTDADVNALVKEYVSLYFGPGAEQVQAYIDEMEALYAELKKGDFGIKISGYIFQQPYFSADVYPLAMLEGQVKMLEEGILAVESSDLPQAEKEVYSKAAVKMLRALDEKHCDWSERNDCFLTHCSSAYHSPKHNHTLVYADCFFLEALLKLNGDEILLW
jgi:hypothetical protein